MTAMPWGSMAALLLITTVDHEALQDGVMHGNRRLASAHNVEQVRSGAITLLSQTTCYFREPPSLMIQ